MDEHIAPYGWGDWGHGCAAFGANCFTDPHCWCTNITYAEFNSTGPGGGAGLASARVKWSHQLTPAQAVLVTPAAVLRGWMPLLEQPAADDQPSPFTHGMANGISIDHINTNISYPNGTTESCPNCCVPACLCSCCCPLPTDPPDFNSTKFLIDWGVGRCGRRHPGVEVAWGLLAETVYRPGQPSALHRTYCSAYAPIGVQGDRCVVVVVIAPSLEAVLARGTMGEHASTQAAPPSHLSGG
jgi:hypothetical protein